MSNSIKMFLIFFIKAFPGFPLFIIALSFEQGCFSSLELILTSCKCDRTILSTFLILSIGATSRFLNIFHFVYLFEFFFCYFTIHPSKNPHLAAPMERKVARLFHIKHDMTEIPGARCEYHTRFLHRIWSTEISSLLERYWLYISIHFVIYWCQYSISNLNISRPRYVAEICRSSVPWSRCAAIFVYCTSLLLLSGCKGDKAHGIKVMVIMW